MNPQPSPSLAESARVWLKVAILSFGGPAAQIGVMQRLVVDEKGWLSQDRFNHALNFCMLLPGPEAQQLATYIGWLTGGVRTGLLAGVLFILPGAAIMLGLSLVYVTVGQTNLAEGLLFGLKCAVLAIVAQALARMVGRVVHGPRALALALLAFAAMFLFSLPFPLVILAAGAVGWLLFRPHQAAAPRELPAPAMRARVPLLAAAAWLVPVLALLAVFGWEAVWSRLAVFFSVLATLSFGGAYAVLSWVAQYAVEGQGWLLPGEMLDGLGLAETTPGPLILVTQFVGFLAAWRQPGALEPLLAGSLGGVLTTWIMFAPSFLWIFLLAPKVEKLRGHRRLTGALAAITAAVVGVIANLAVWFALNLMFAESEAVAGFGLDFRRPVLASLDPTALALTAVAVLLLFRLRLGLLSTVGLMAISGLAIELLRGG